MYRRREAGEPRLHQRMGELDVDPAAWRRRGRRLPRPPAAAGIALWRINLTRARAVPTAVPTSDTKKARLAGPFEPSHAHFVPLGQADSAWLSGTGASRRSAKRESGVPLGVPRDRSRTASSAAGAGRLVSAWAGRRGKRRGVRIAARPSFRRLSGSPAALDASNGRCDRPLDGASPPDAEAVVVDR